MRRTIYLITILFALCLSTACATTAESTPPPVSANIKAAKDYLSKTKADDDHQTWTRAVVLRTRYEHDAWSTDWSMDALLENGAIKTYTPTVIVSVNYDALRAILPGDYVLINDRPDGYVDDTDIHVKTKLAVDFAAHR